MNVVCTHHNHVFMTILMSTYNISLSYIKSKRQSYYENMPIQIYRKSYHLKMKIFRKISDILHIFAQNIDCGYALENRLGKAVLMRTHILCFGAEISKIMYTLVNPRFTV